MLLVRNYADAFEVNDFVVGPRVKLGANAIGFVKEIKAQKLPIQINLSNSRNLVITVQYQIDAKCI